MGVTTVHFYIRTDTSPKGKQDSIVLPPNMAAVTWSYKAYILRQRKPFHQTYFNQINHSISEENQVHPGSSNAFVVQV